MSRLALLKHLPKPAVTSVQLTQSDLAKKREGGFTLLEIIVVVLIIAVLSAIVAPGWLAFVNRQRVAKVNDAVFSAMQEAQSEAKQKKLKYSVSFRKEADELPEVAIHLASSIDPTNWNWQNLTQELDVKPNQIVIESNIDASNPNNALNTPSTIDNTHRTITFDQFGNIPIVDPATNLDDLDEEQGLGITVAIPDGGAQPIESTKRCTIVATLLGSLRTAQGEDCP
ncbi:MAG: prepilin-type N-terminal cleavage/methylation domain-containing protein [Coleofasciculus sp. C2-GNP5-27]